MPEQTTTHGRYLLLVRVAGLDDEAIRSGARTISKAYMELFRSHIAFTFAVRHLRSLPRGPGQSSPPEEWQYAVEYVGPRTSVDWLHNRIAEHFAGTAQSVSTVTFEVEDVTGLI